MDEVCLLCKWYVIDFNNIESRYTLQPISALIPNFTSKDEILVDDAEREWKFVVDRLHDAFSIAVHKKKQERYHFTDIYQDLTKAGVLGCSSNTTIGRGGTRPFFFGYFRDFVQKQSSPSFFTNPFMKQYLDVTSDGYSGLYREDSDKKVFLKEVKQAVVRKGGGSIGKFCLPKLYSTAAGAR